MVEPTWTSHDDGSYTRPLLGSEAGSDMLDMMENGHGQNCIGLSFTAKLSDDVLVDRVRGAMLHLRFSEPLIAARLFHDGDSIFRSWKYEVASKREAAQEWCEQALKIHRDERSLDDFIVEMTKTRLPYTSGSHTLFFVCHLVLRDSGTYSIVFQGTHSIMDAWPTIDALACTMGCISSAEKAQAASSLAWSREWVNLAEGPITSSGGAQKGYETAVPKLVDRLTEIANVPTATKSLTPQRADILDAEGPVRTRRVLDENASAMLFRAVKGLGLTVTVLFEAAIALTIFERCQLDIDEDETAHVTFDLTSIKLNQRFVPPHDRLGRLGSALVVAPIIVWYKDVKGLERKDQLITIMKILKKQYNDWTASPHLPQLAGRFVPPAAPNPYSPFLTNLGVIEQRLSRKWPAEGAPVLEVRDFAIEQRNAANSRAISRMWTWDSKIHLQVQSSDVWDKEYLDQYLVDVVKNASLLL